MTRQKDNTAAWQFALRNTITQPKELLALLELDPALLPEAERAAKSFPLKAPLSFVARMQKGNKEDPLLRQVLPLGLELQEVAGYRQDPLEEADVNPLPGLLHKYHGRVLLTWTGACGINCRYCFRRHFPYAENNPGTTGWDRALEYIAKDTSISEVILSGGDPLIATDASLRQFSTQLETISHVKRLRIHSRMPIVLPERITDSFLEWMAELKQQPILVVHCNHPQEIDLHVKEAMQKLKHRGVTLLNQSVLLKGINDDANILCALSETLFEIGIQPYYLHVLDKVAGAAHFDIPLEQAQKLHGEMVSRLSGYLVPKLVKEEPKAPAKLSVALQNSAQGDTFSLFEVIK